MCWEILNLPNRNNNYLTKCLMQARGGKTAGFFYFIADYYDYIRLNQC